MTAAEDIARQARAWEAQLRDQGLRPMDARRIAQREAGWQGWALEERLAAADPVKWYGPDGPEARTDPAELAAEAEALIARARPQFEASQREVLAEASARAVPPPSAAAAEPSSPEPGTGPNRNRRRPVTHRHELKERGEHGDH